MREEHLISLSSSGRTGKKRGITTNEREKSTQLFHRLFKKRPHIPNTKANSCRPVIAEVVLSWTLLIARTWLSFSLWAGAGTWLSPWNEWKKWILRVMGVSEFVNRCMGRFEGEQSQVSKTTRPQISE